MRKISSAARCRSLRVELNSDAAESVSIDHPIMLRHRRLDLLDFLKMYSRVRLSDDEPDPIPLHLRLPRQVGRARGVAPALVIVERFVSVVRIENNPVARMRGGENISGSVAPILTLITSIVGSEISRG